MGFVHRWSQNIKAVDFNQVENEEEDQDLIYHIPDKLCGEVCRTGN